MSYLVNITRATGWGREYILWELPLAHGLQVMHCEALFQGETRDWANGELAGEVVDAAETMREQFRTLSMRRD